MNPSPITWPIWVVLFVWAGSMPALAVCTLRYGLGEAQPRERWFGRVILPFLMLVWTLTAGYCARFLF